MAETKEVEKKTLSAGGNEVLIKAVIQAIPSYVMSCVLLPVSLCREIESMVSRFWWGQKKEEHRIHWASWSCYCMAKKEGGLGFHDIHSINMAMLAKQGWRLLNDGNSFLRDILKSKYYSY